MCLFLFTVDENKIHQIIGNIVKKKKIGNPLLPEVE